MQTTGYGYNSAASTLMQPLEHSDENRIMGSSISDNLPLMKIINVIEGFKTRVKELHFCAKQFKTERGNFHVLMEEVLDLISDYQDVLGEVGQAFLGHMRHNSLNGVPVSCTCPVEIISMIIRSVMDFKDAIPQSREWAGIINATDDFIQNIQQKLYLAQIYAGA